jgi:RNA polymerase sigma-70 factor (ECF subfamily)
VSICGCLILNQILQSFCIYASDPILSENLPRRCYSYERADLLKGSPVSVTAKDLKEESTRVAAQDVEETAEFEAAFQEHWPRVYGIAFRLVGDRAEAEDLALETFWRLFQRSPRTGENLGGWLYRVATNLGFNALRARKRRDRYEEEAGQSDWKDREHLDPAALFERVEERRQVRAALAQMKPRTARLLVLRYSGLSYAELASTLGLARGSIGTLLSRAEQEFLTNYQKIQGG